MSPPTQAMVEEVESQLLSMMNTPVGTSAMDHIDKELTPFMREMLKLPQEDMDSHAYKYIFDWLTHPQRTTEEFNYAVGPLGYHVFYVVMNEHSIQKDTNQNIYYLFFVAAEAPATKGQVLSSLELSA